MLFPEKRLEFEKVVLEKLVLICVLGKVVSQIFKFWGLKKGGKPKYIQIQTRENHSLALC